MLLNCGAEETFESPLESKVIKPVNPKGNKSWILIARTDAEAPIFWQRADSLEKTLKLGKIKRRRRRGWQRMRCSDGITASTDMSLNKLQEIVKDWEDQCAAVHGIAKSWMGLSDWTTNNNHEERQSPLQFPPARVINHYFCCAEIKVPWRGHPEGFWQHWACSTFPSAFPRAPWLFQVCHGKATMPLIIYIWQDWKLTF